MSSFSSNNRQHFATLPTDEVGKVLLGKVQDYFSALYGSSRYEYWKKAYLNYYGGCPLSPGINRVGEKGEVSKIRIGIFRNFLQNLLVMATSEKPSFEARAINTDHKSLSQTMLAEGILEYYLREKRLMKKFIKAVEYSLIRDTGYIIMDWNTGEGNEYGVDPQTGRVMRDGDIEYMVGNPFTVVIDRDRESDQQDWYIYRRKRNKYDMAAKNPELAEQIISVNNIDDSGFGGNALWHQSRELKNDDIWEYTFLHRRTDAVEAGRMVRFITAEIVTLDGPLPFKTIPVYRVAPSDWLDMPDGYTVAYDLIPIQEGLNELLTRVFTNNMTFGMQNITGPKMADIELSQLSGGLNYIGMDQKMGEIKPLQLTASPAESYRLLEMLERWGEGISGLNSVVRGSPEGALKGASGAAMALLASQAIKFSMGLQMSVNDMMENVATATVEFLQTFANTPRMATIAGKTNRGYMKEFQGKDLTGVNRVTIAQAAALSKTASGRLEIARDLLQAQKIRTPEEYLQIITTGTLQPMIEADQSELMLIRSENESLRDSRKVVAVKTDAHGLHIREHKTVVNDPTMRFGPESADMTEATLVHIQEHIDFLKNTDPALLALIGEQPIAPMAPPPPPPGNPAEMPPPGPGPSLDQMPSDPNMPQNPLTGEQFNNIDGGGMV
jgi:hypothetical protein